MSALTKTFVVLLVVMSLLSAAGFVVFVNRVEDFRTAATTSQGQITQLKAEVAQAKSQVGAVQASLDASRRDVAAAEAENTRLANEDAAKVAALNATVANDQSQARIASVSMDNSTAALNASEAQRKGLTDALTQARTDNDTLAKRNSDLNLAVSDLTQRNDVAGRKVTDLSEQLTEAKGTNDRYGNILKEHGLSPTEAPDRVTASAPAINGVVRDTRPINGIPYATISVGSAEQVSKGMVFNVIDRSKGEFLGELTIDSVDLHEATGKLEGPHVGDIRVGVDVRTQL